ncbi:MAG: UDP-N-acetylmuramate dehydrogenase [Patescibacteria group bacterium]|nr:UDP-N-acetylmuramate dehydrogenase [Patescibacteria group bacterium]
MEIKKNIPLEKMTTFKIGGPARYFCAVENIDDLAEAQQFAVSNNIKTFILGGGSNILFSDRGFDGLVIKIQNEALSLKQETSGKYTIQSSAGTPLSKLAAFSIKNSLTGLEWAMGVPGLVGGAIQGNAGAFGSEMKDCISIVRTVDRESSNWSNLMEISCDDCNFSYRNSAFKENKNHIIWDCEINLSKGNKLEIEKKVLKYASHRSKKQPPLAKFPSAGSIFKNPVVSKKVHEAFEHDMEVKCRTDRIPAGWLIERCDLKGKRIGNAMVSRKQANFIINLGKATAEDVIILISFIKMKARNEFGVQLKEEIQVVL